MQNNPRKQDIIQELRGKRQDVTELCTEAEAVNEPHIGSGIVTDCLYLNVRKLPDINADVAVVIDAPTQVCVDLDASTEDFYKVRTSDGVEGFCMRRSASMYTTESILTLVKKLLGIDESYTHFDADLIMHINSVFSILGQMGVGPKKGFAISGADEKWSDFLEDDPGRLALVKSYMHLKVRLLFDLPTASSAIDAMNRQISEFEWRLFVAADNAAREEESQNG